MPETIYIKEVAKNNPQVDSEKLGDGLEALKKLKESGQAEPASYNLETPFSRKVIRPCEPLSHVKHQKKR